MIKCIKRCFLVVVSALILTGCNGETIENVPDVSKNAPAEPLQEEFSVEYPLVIRTGYSTSKEDPRGIALDSFKKEVEKNTDGNIIVEIHSDGELGSDSVLIEGLIEKNVDMTVSSAGNYALYATKIGVSALPFLFSDFESAWKFIDSSVMQNLSLELENYNMHVLAFFDNGFRCVTTSERVGAVRTIDDMKGLNIRTPENQIVMETMSELSANPKSYPFAKLKNALIDGTFDAQENPIPVIYSNKLYEVQKYLSITNHSYDAMPLTIRNDIWLALDSDYKEVIKKAAKNAEEQNRQLVKQQTEECVKYLEEEGMEVVYPDLEPFRTATSGVMDVFSSVYGKELIKYIEQIN